MEVSPTLLFEYPTVAALAAEIARLEAEHQIETLAAELSGLPPEEAGRLLRETTSDSP